MAEQLTKLISKEVISKKELVNLEIDFVEHIVNKVIEANKKIRKKIEVSNNFKEFKKSKEFKSILKQTRSILREIYGIFILPGYEKKQELVEKYFKTKQQKFLDELLLLHKSTKERMPYYEEVYDQLFSLIPKAKKILDLGCGLNPFAYSYLPNQPLYVASDLNAKDCEFIQEFFRKLKIKGISFTFDLTQFHQTKFTKYLDADVCFLFKVLDSLESLKKNISEKLIDGLPCKYIVVSFPTQSIGGRKKIRISSRAWFLKMVNRKGWNLESFEIPGEVFYIVMK